MDKPSGNSEFASLREDMVSQQVAGRGIHAPPVLRAMRLVPREIFVPTAMRARAYEDSALSIDEGQTISQPYIVGYMLEALHLQPGDRVLEVGTGSGYGAALLGKLVAEVHTIERIPALANAAAKRLRRCGHDNVHVHIGDGTRGYPVEAPYDAIAVTAGGPVIPSSLEQQLALGGRLVMPIGTPGDQVLMRVRRTGTGRCERESLTGCRFVPLIGDEGWPIDD